MGEPPAGDKKSFIDATLIKYYNGGTYYKIRTNEKTGKPEWYINQTSKIEINGKTEEHNYVEKVCKSTE